MSKFDNLWDLLHEAGWRNTADAQGDGLKSIMPKLRRLWAKPRPSAADVLRDRIIELEKEHGSIRAVSRATGVDGPYLSRLKSGKKGNPSGALLAALGLRRVSHIERAKDEPYED